MICSVIDIGSNTVRLSVFKTVDGEVRTLFSEKQSVGLASYRDGNVLTDEGVQKLLAVLTHFKKIIDNFDAIEETYAIATASLRDVKNCDEIVERARVETGVNIELISGNEEARLAFLGASQFLPDHEQGILADIGGGSTEIVRFRKNEMLENTSLSIGSLTAYNNYIDKIFMSATEREKLGSDLKEMLKMSGISRANNDYLCGVGGSARATLLVYNEYFGTSVANRIMTTDKLKELRDALIEMDNERLFKKIIQVKADRMHTLLPGMCILYRIAKYFKVHLISVSETGIREGFVYNKVLGKDDKEEVVESQE